MGMDGVGKWYGIKGNMNTYFKLYLLSVLLAETRLLTKQDSFCKLFDKL